MSANCTKFAAGIAKRVALPKTEADTALPAFQDILIEFLKKGETVKVTGLMNAERVSRTARTGRNLRTDEKIKTPAGFGVEIFVGSTLKKAVTQQSVSQH